MIRLKYGNTNTFWIDGLLVDTDYAGMLPAFYRELKKNGLTLGDIRYVLATHYHPDHMGLIGELMKQGVKLLLIDVQKDSVHFSDPIFAKKAAHFFQNAASAVRSFIRRVTAKTAFPSSWTTETASSETWIHLRMQRHMRTPPP